MLSKRVVTGTAVSVGVGSIPQEANIVTLFQQTMLYQSTIIVP
jgi:hypothetical protein